jgi:hypothetical protein
VLGGYMLGFAIIGLSFAFFLLVDFLGQGGTIALLAFIVFAVAVHAWRRIKGENEIQITPGPDVEDDQQAKLAEVTHQLDEVSGQLRQLQHMIEQRRG